jgi:hypothetical protein
MHISGQASMFLQNPLKGRTVGSRLFLNKKLRDAEADDRTNRYRESGEEDLGLEAGIILYRFAGSKPVTGTNPTGLDDEYNNWATAASHLNRYCMGRAGEWEFFGDVDQARLQVARL